MNRMVRAKRRKGAKYVVVVAAEVGSAVAAGWLEDEGRCAAEEPRTVC